LDVLDAATGHQAVGETETRHPGSGQDGILWAGGETVGSVMKIENRAGTIIITPMISEFPILKKWIKMWGSVEEIPWGAFRSLIKACQKVHKGDNYATQKR